MKLIIKKGDLFFLDEGFLTEMRNSLHYAKRHSTTPVRLTIYRNQVAHAEKFLTEQKRDTHFPELSVIEKDTLNNLIEKHRSFLKETKQ